MDMSQCIPLSLNRSYIVYNYTTDSLTILLSNNTQANGVFFVFDLTKPDTLARIGEYWLPNYKKSCRDSAMIFLIGAKYDLKDERKVSEEDARKFKTEHEMRKYYEISSLSGHGVDSLFQAMAMYILRDHPEEVALRNDVISLHERRESEPGSAKGNSGSCSCQLL